MTRGRTIFYSAVSRDNLWISKKEHQALVDGKFLTSLQQRLARYHLVDNTRGEPPMWREDEVKKVILKMKDGVITGEAHLETASSDRGYIADIYGVIEFEDEKGHATRPNRQRPLLGRGSIHETGTQGQISAGGFFRTGRWQRRGGCHSAARFTRLAAGVFSPRRLG